MVFSETVVFLLCYFSQCMCSPVCSLSAAQKKRCQKDDSVSLCAFCESVGKAALCLQKVAPSWHGCTEAQRTFRRREVQTDKMTECVLFSDQTKMSHLFKTLNFHQTPLSSKKKRSFTLSSVLSPQRNRPWFQNTPHSYFTQ